MTISLLNYDPTIDILEENYPDLHNYLLSKIKRSIDTVLATVTQYDVKRVLLDSTRGPVLDNVDHLLLILA